MKTKGSLLIIVIVLIISPVLVYAQRMDMQKVSSNLTAQSFKDQAVIQHSSQAKDPLITQMVASVSADTIEHTLRELQNWGSRFALNDNHKALATSLMQKFLSYGYTDVKLDSFLCVYNDDTSMQYNVICTLSGLSAPKEIFMIGAHYDSYNKAILTGPAPGIDDDGSGVAAVFEVSRVMAAFNYHPEATIQFTLFAGEELWMKGSAYDAAKAKQEGKDIRFMLNMDMIGNNPNNLNKIIGFSFQGFEWAAIQSATSIETYSGIIVDIVDATGYEAGDYGPYVTTNGYPATSFKEVDFSPFYHTQGDTVGNCNIPFIAKFSGGVLAALIEQISVPLPKSFRAYSTKEDIKLEWKPLKNIWLKQTNIYRSDYSGSGFELLATTPLTDTIYHDLTVVKNKPYFYVLTTVNDSLQESSYSVEVSGARYDFSDTLLVLSNMKGTIATPDSVFAFYQAVLDTIPYVWHDINATRNVSPDLFSRYSSVLWISNNTDFKVTDKNSKQYISDYISNKGNILFAGFYPLRFWLNDQLYSKKIPETELFNQIFKVDSVKITNISMMFRANAVVSGYDTLNVDTLKYLNKSFPGQIFNIDCFAPTSEGNVIYRFDTKYSPTTNMGKMKNRPVGIEYMGNDFKSILLSFPLYYMDTIDAKEFLHFVMTQKFKNTGGIDDFQPVDPFDLYIFPNPVSTSCHMTFKLIESGRVKISLFTMQGQLVKTILNANMQQGSQNLNFQTGELASGLYEIILQNGKNRCVKKIVKL